MTFEDNYSLLSRIGIKQPKWKELTNLESAKEFCDEVCRSLIFYLLFSTISDLI